MLSANHLDVTMWLVQGLAPETVQSAFKENLQFSSCADLHDYPVSTETHRRRGCTRS